MNKSNIPLSFTLLYLSTASTSLPPTPTLGDCLPYAISADILKMCFSTTPTRLQLCLWNTTALSNVENSIPGFWSSPLLLSFSYPWHERKFIFLTFIPEDNAHCGHREPREPQNLNGQICKWVLMINSQTLQLLYTYLEGYRHCIKINISQDKYNAASEA